MSNTTVGTAVDERTAADQKAKDDAAEKSKTEAAAARDEFSKLDTQAREDRAAADAELDPAKKTEAEKKAKESAQKADDARAKAHELDSRNALNVKPTSVADAKTLAMVPDSMPAGHHLAQKFGNDPANPKHDDTLDPRADTVRLSRKTPDNPDLVYCDAHPDMVGDYMRAGWNRADVGDLGRNRSAASDQTWQGKDVTVVRDADSGDKGFDAAQSDQVLVRFEDGTTRLVPRSELKKREVVAA